MKWVLKTLLVFMVLYVVTWGAIAVYFSHADRHKAALEQYLSRQFDAPVTIGSLSTTWTGTSPTIELTQLQVESDVEGESALSLKSLSAQLSPLSVLRFWPIFTDLSVEKPQIEIVSLGTNRLKVAGIDLISTSGDGIDPQKIIAWLLDQKQSSWHQGEVVWRRLDGETQRYQNITFDFMRRQQQRDFIAEVTTPKGVIAVKFESQGDLLSDTDWNASLEVLGNEGQPLLSPDDLSLKVDNGQGVLELKALDVVRVRDFIRLTGLADHAQWLLDAQLSGRLRDVEFMFSGPLLNFVDWSLIASADQLGFKSVGKVPAMDKLSGHLQASSDGGRFVFSTQNSVFEWSSLFDTRFPIMRASGEFSWQIQTDSTLVMALNDGVFEDDNIALSNIQASLKSKRGVQQISSFGQLFKVDSVADLNYQEGKIVQGNAAANPVYLDASADFDFKRMAAFSDYLPNSKRFSTLKTWWQNAFLGGQASNGKIRYVGELSKTAMDNGKAELSAQADYQDVVIDYGYQRDWPRVEQGQGSATLENGLLTIKPERIYLEDNPLRNSYLQISSLFKKDILLSLQGEVTMSLPDSLEFLFQGPLIVPDKRPKTLPVTSDAGLVDIKTSVTLPLNKLSEVTVDGSARIREGRLWLPPEVPIEKIEGVVSFTERTVTATDINALFLGGEAVAQVSTVQEAQPPVMRVTAKGQLNTQQLEPWVGEHLLTWFEGTSDWQGSILIDGTDIDIAAKSSLQGVTISAPEPLTKSSSTSRELQLSMQLSDQQSILLNYDGVMMAALQANKGKSGSLFDHALIAIDNDGAYAKEVTANGAATRLKEGVHFEIKRDDIDLDAWLSAIIDIASYQPKKPSNNTDFLDAMRGIQIQAQNPVFLNRDFGRLEVSALSVDGAYWIGKLNGDNLTGTMRLEPRAPIGRYRFDLASLNLGVERESTEPLPPIDYTLAPESYPAVELTVDNFQLTGKNLGRLEVRGEPQQGAWTLTQFDMSHNGTHTTASGKWVNNADDGSMSSFDYETKIKEAEGTLDDMSLDGFVKKGKGRIHGNMNWIGAPHEFDYSRLNGHFDLRIEDGELVKVEPGGGKLLGLLNFNAIARRLTLDFRDIFASGLTFDRMQYIGVLSDGNAIMREAYIFTPAVFVRMEGKVDLANELIDLEIHMSPELGGNIALLSALANPAAGAVVFITQRLFKDEVRNSSFRSYRAFGTWEDFEMVEFQPNSEGIETAPAQEKATSDQEKQAIDRANEPSILEPTQP